MALTNREDLLYTTMLVRWVPHAYQKRGVKFLVEHPAAGLILDPGMGKTSITLGALKVLQRFDRSEKMLVIAPRRPARLVWPKEVTKWEDFSHFKVEVLHGDKKEEALERDADIYTINPEGLPWLLENNGKRLKALIKRGVTTLTVDESTKFKRVTTKRFKLLKPFLALFRRRWILTGTPSPNGYLDLFGQIYIMDLGKALGQYITHYRNQFFYPTGFGGYTWKMQKGADKAIQARLKPCTMVLSADDYLELPEQIVNPIWVELPVEARRVYTQMEVALVAVLESAKTVTAATASAASMKCAQVANGAIYLDKEPGQAPRPGERWAPVHDEKIEALLDLIEDLQGKPLLIAYEFQHDLERLVAALGKDTPVMGQSDKKDEAIERAWNAGELPYVLGHPASIGHGLNMQYGGCEDVCWFGTTWDLELYDQFNRRVRRQGNKTKWVRIHHILARDTVDEYKMLALRSKDMDQRGLLQALKTRVRNRTTGKNLCFTGVSARSRTNLSKGGRPQSQPAEGDFDMTTAAKKPAVKVSAKKATTETPAKVGVAKDGVKVETAQAAVKGTKATTAEVKAAKKDLNKTTNPAKAEKPAKAPKAPKETAPRVSPTVEFVRLPKGDEKVAPQALVILETMNAMVGKAKAKTVTVHDLTERLEKDGKLNTKQPASAIWNHYRRKLEDAGFVKL